MQLAEGERDVRRRAAPRLVLPALVLAVLVAALSLLAFPAATAEATVSTHPASRVQLAGTVPSAPMMHDEAAVHRSSVGALLHVPVTVVPDGQHPASPQFIGAGAEAGQAHEPGSEATITVQGRAPPATAR